MSLAQQAIKDLREVQIRFNRSTALLSEDISGFAPCSAVMTTAQQVAHAAQVIDWFMEGAFRQQGFDLNFDPQIRRVLSIHSLSAARVRFERSTTNAIEILAVKSDEDLMQLLPTGPILQALPVLAVISASVDHTVHHRDALTVHARMNGIIPPDPFAD